MSSGSGKRIWLIAGILGIVSVAVVAFALHIRDPGEAHGVHDHSDKPVLTLNDGKKWETDATLRRGMARIAALVAPLAAKMEGERLDPIEAARVADDVRDEVNILISNCRLEPRADAALHVLIGDMLAGADILSQPEPSIEGVRTISEALDLYPRYFEDTDPAPAESSL
jgi:hypothetical protein